MNDFFQVLIIALVLSLDAFSVSIALGLKSRTHSLKEASLISIFFGGFQAAMPLLGWFIGNLLKDSFQSVSSWIAFILLFATGAKMIYESIFGEEKVDKKLSISTLIVLSIATSIDALIVGTTLALVSLPIVLSIDLIGIITFIMCIVGYYAGNKLGTFFQDKIEIIGGVALILLGLKFLIF